MVRLTSALGLGSVLASVLIACGGPSGPSLVIEIAAPPTCVETESGCIGAGDQLTLMLTPTDAPPARFSVTIGEAESLAVAPGEYSVAVDDAITPGVAPSRIQVPAQGQVKVVLLWPTGRTSPAS